jgi:hypothetical protein
MLNNCVFGTYRASATKTIFLSATSENPATVRIVLCLQTRKKMLGRDHRETFCPSYARHLVSPTGEHLASYVRIQVMRQNTSRLGRWTVTIGAIMFIAVLFISAYWEPDIRWLHFFQAWMYVATSALVWIRNRWGCFIGVGAAALWNYLTLFVNTFLKNGLNQASILLATGHLPRPDLFVSVPGWLGNLAVIVGCLCVYASLTDKEWSDAPKFAVAVAGTTGFFALIVALFQPRYLALFPGLLHPHLHL